MMLKARCRPFTVTTSSHIVSWIKGSPFCRRRFQFLNENCFHSKFPEIHTLRSTRLAKSQYWYRLWFDAGQGGLKQWPLICWRKYVSLIISLNEEISWCRGRIISLSWSLVINTFLLVFVRVRLPIRQASSSMSPWASLVASNSKKNVMHGLVKYFCIFLLTVRHKVYYYYNYYYYYYYYYCCCYYYCFYYYYY